jgi:hypothetical protein
MFTFVYVLPVHSWIMFTFVYVLPVHSWFMFTFVYVQQAYITCHETTH